ncbi:MAG TPA: ethanolamine ammonia-lyase reactivating factor EutA [Burkholderiales bacterium]|nr:ethanolamine ammonia-lyase reactivating factor EutA [Burkholderiales bacterium]
MADGKPPKKTHSLADHVHGHDHDHVHDGDETADHDHDHFSGEESSPEDSPLWAQDHVSLRSVGIDIGSSGTQVIFSRIDLRRMGEELSSRYYVVARETLFQSPVSLTPYKSEELIDEDALAAIIDRAFADAGQHPDDIDAGVVILTGEALRRENAGAIAALLAEQRGEFVCASAGHHMEAMLAAYGSGAARVSSDSGKLVLNIDIGGGTTKLALVERGKVIATAALHVGGRLLVVDEADRIVRLDPAGKRLAELSGFRWSRGDVVDHAAMERVAGRMAEYVLASVAGPMSETVRTLLLTEPLPDLGRIDGVMFSGGVGEYVYGREARDFGDMGRLLGLALRNKLDAGALPWPLLPPGECIRATALGASEYSVQLSGNTIYISDPGALLPRRNLQVLQPDYACGERIDPDALARAIRAHFTAFDLVEGETEAALALRWQGTPSYERIAALAAGIARGLQHTLAKRAPVYVMVDGDIAQTLGAILRDEIGVESEVLVIDGVVLWDFDYIDLGRIRMPSQTVPVTVKSLVFGEDPRDRSAPRNARKGTPRSV